MSQQCQNCHQTFIITLDNLEFYKKMTVSPPTLCPHCRQQRRLAWRNERMLYPSTCTLCHRSVITTYAPHGTVLKPQPFIIYCQECWWSDRWSAAEYAQPIDVERPFFEQYAELHARVPRIALMNTNSINSAYTHYTANNKNCYMIFSNAFGDNEDCYYGTQLSKSRNCVDTMQIENCELCYDCVDCANSYRLIHGNMCDHCLDSAFLEDCRNCRNCFMCKGLRNKQFCILNKQYDQAGYEAELQRWQIDQPDGWQKAWQTFNDWRCMIPAVFSYQLNSEQCTGDYIVRSSQCSECFDTTDSEQCQYLQFSVKNNKEIYDASYSGGNELCLENMGCVSGYHIYGSTTVWWNIKNLTYCQFCFNTVQDCFGCIGLRNKQYCILNTQYTPAEYQRLTNIIIEQLQQSGQWGRFLPSNLSFYGYNETIAQDYFPLTRQQALDQGFNWNDHLPDATRTDNPTAITCATCKKLFRCTTAELQFYQTMQLPKPDQCFNCRHLARLRLRRPRQLWQRHCQQCQRQLDTAYSPDRPEMIYCEQCYQRAIY
ncbi:MAG: zinc-ribbon domain containing protein [Candidatus Kerfeldbacteria bacterium]|nr:zinc-ribbon domain containing protein [Candidatus Kerfeldbacteria bacterium]